MDNEKITPLDAMTHEAHPGSEFKVIIIVLTLCLLFMIGVGWIVLRTRPAPTPGSEALQLLGVDNATNTDDTLGNFATSSIVGAASSSDNMPEAPLKPVKPVSSAMEGSVSHVVSAQAGTAPATRQTLPGVPVTSETIQLDLNHDGLINNEDTALVATKLNEGDYDALEDFDSDGKITTMDLLFIRSQLLGNPSVFFDLNSDTRVDGDDIAIVANAINGGVYDAMADLNSDGVVDTMDLSFVRAGVSDAGSAQAATSASQNATGTTAGPTSIP